MPQYTTKLGNVQCQINKTTEISIEEGCITNRPQEGDSASPDAEPYCHVIFVQACLKEKVKCQEFFIMASLVPLDCYECKE